MISKKKTAFNFRLFRLSVFISRESIGLANAQAHSRKDRDAALNTAQGYSSMYSPR